jgi:hypothetical protein
MTRTRPAPLGATYKRGLRPICIGSKPDVAPSGAKRVLRDPSYKDPAPMELFAAMPRVGTTVKGPVATVKIRFCLNSLRLGVLA